MCIDTLVPRMYGACLSIDVNRSRSLQAKFACPDTEQHRAWVLVIVSHIYCADDLQYTVAPMSRIQESLDGMWHTLPAVVTAPMAAHRPRHSNQRTLCDKQLPGTFPSSNGCGHYADAVDAGENLQTMCDPQILYQDKKDETEFKSRD